MSEELNITLVESKHGDFIYSSPVTNGYSSYVNFESYLINNAEVEKTYRSGWFKVSGKPEKIEKIIPGKTTTLKFKLKEGYTPNEIILAELAYNYDFYSEDGDSSLRKYYDSVTETTPETKEEVKFKLNIYSYNEFKPIQISFTPQYDIMASIITPGQLWSEIPCSLGPKDTYGIIRQYIKENIDSRYAFLSSDYDFCLTLKKRIQLVSPQAYTTVNIWKSKKGRKAETTKYLSHREFEIFEMAPSPYQKYSLAPSFDALSTNELNEKILDFCKNIVKKANEPLRDCKHCKGKGVIIDG